MTARMKFAEKLEPSVPRALAADSSKIGNEHGLHTICRPAKSGSIAIPETTWGSAILPHDESGSMIQAHLRFKTFIGLSIMILFGPLGNVLLGKGMKHLGTVSVHTPAQILHTLIGVFTSVTIWGGIASLMTFYLSYMLLLSWADYTFVQPSSSVSYGIVAVLSHFLLNEVISPIRWLGIAVICLGVFMVSSTPPHTTGRADVS